MKHILNFKPLVVYRKGSSFLLKTALVLMYLVPIYMGCYHYFNYKYAGELVETYGELDKALSEKVKNFAEEVQKVKPEMEQLASLEGRYFDYRVLSGVAQASMASLLSRLEAITPGEVKFSSVSVKPNKLVKLRLVGATPELRYLTEFLRNLYADKVFVEPVIKSHKKQRVQRQGTEHEISFVVEVDYLGESGELP
jgi:hypothetical protein